MTTANPTRRTIFILLLLAASVSMGQQKVQRLEAAPFRIYHTPNSPSRILYQGQDLVTGLYAYTAIRPGGKGRGIEGFNFRRDEDGKRKMRRRQVEGGVELSWENERTIRAKGNPMHGQVAGRMTITLTARGDEVTLRWKGSIEPATGFGEIGFFLPEKALLDAGVGELDIRTLTKAKRSGPLPWTGTEKVNCSRVDRITVKNAARSMGWSFSGSDFKGSHGVHFQDHRKEDTHLGCYRVVLGFDTKQGNTLDYVVTLRTAENVARPAPAPQTAGAGTLSMPVLPKRPASISVQVGKAPFAVAKKAGTPLQGTASATGALKVERGASVLLGDDYNTLTGGNKPTRESQDLGNGRQRTVLRYETKRGVCLKEIVSSPTDVWVMWRITAKTAIRGEVGCYLPAASLAAPFITYRHTNQSMVAERDEPEFSSAYCILSGGPEKMLDIQYGSTSNGAWIFQDFRKRGNRYRLVTTPRLQAGDTWCGVVRFAVNEASQPWPEIGTDRARVERGISASLLPDAQRDGFTVIPSRAAHYVLLGQPIQVRLASLNLNGVPRTIRCDWRLLDMWNRVLHSGTEQIVGAKAPLTGTAFGITTSASGCYRVEMTCTSGKTVQKRELIFTVIPDIPDTGVRPGSVFGAAIAGGDYIGELARRIGLKWNRCHCAIGDTQAGTILPERGAYRWNAVDAACEFHQKFGFSALHSISEGWRAKWLSELWKAGDFDAYLKAYIDEYVRPLAVRYKGRIRYWEVTNEPYYQFRECPEKWVQLMRRTYETLKEVDPTCTVVGTCGPPGSMGYGWYRKTFALGALDYQDMVSSHLYNFGPWIGSGIAVGVRGWIHRIRETMQENGKVLPIWNSETTISPPATMYRHPSHRRYCRYHPGEGPTDPIEQAQTYFKILTVHCAEDVKYSFHIFHGGIEYTSHTAEYDETPLSMTVAQATLAKYLETAKFLGDVKVHPQLQVFAFQSGDRLLLIPWGPNFLKQDSATVSVAIPFAKTEARDIFDNQLALEGDAKGIRMQWSWETFLLFVDGISFAEMQERMEDATVTLHISQESASGIKGTFGGDDAGPANRADWLGFHPLDLGTAANRSFTDEEPGDKKGGWTDEGPNDLRFLPTGDWKVNGVPFRILDATKNQGKSCIVLKGGVHPDPPLPASVVIPVKKRLSKLHMLHTVTWGGKSNPAFTYVLHFSDGVVERMPVVCGRNVADWWWQGKLPDALTAWEGPNPAHEKVRLYQATYEIAHPKGAQATLDRVEVVSECGRPVPAVVAITGVYSN